jgi:hypothetical protein
MIVGSAIHEVIRMLHDNPGLDIPSLVEQEIENQVSRRVDVPVLWGEKKPWDRDGRTATAIRKVEMYWAYNHDIKVVRQEAWYWFELPVENDPPLLMRGKVDQVIDDDGELVLRELKGGDRETTLLDMETDDQVALQAFGLWKGFVSVEDNLPYVGEKDEHYHIHDFQPVEGKEGKFKCAYPNCEVVAEKPGVFPARIVYYDLSRLDPGKTKWDKGERIPKGEPETILEPIEENVLEMVTDVGHAMLAIRNAEKTGRYLPPFATGFDSPCDGCYVSDHCTKRVCKARKGNSLNVGS